MLSRSASVLRTPSVIRALSTSLKSYPINGFFDAKTYAIIGASEKQGSLGYIISDNFYHKFQGKTYFVNPKGGQLFGQPIYKSALDIPEKIEGVVISISAKFTVDALKQCLERGAKWVTIVPGGFRETGTKEGIAAEDEIVRLANEYKCRIVGPNCMGVFDPRNVDTLFIGDRGLSKPKLGPVGLFSQSGALGTALLNELSGATQENWISRFISFGNACDVDEKDCIDYFEQDPSVKQIWAYMEGFHNAPDFLRSVKRISQKKPVMILKSNRGNSGAKASASHSASLAADDAVCDQLLRNAGAIRCDVWADLHNIGTVLRNQPLPKGRRVAVVTDAGGFGVLLADSVDTFKMNLTDFSPETVKKFRATFPPFYACSNPMDLTGSVKTHEFIEAAKLALDDPNVDSVIFAYQPGAPGLELPLEMAKTIEKNFGPGKTKKPFIVLEFGGKYPDDDVIRDYLKQVGMSVYDGPEEGMRVLAKLTEYSEYLQRVQALKGETHPSIDASLINGLVSKVANKGRYTLTEIEGYDVGREACV